VEGFAEPHGDVPEGLKITIKGCRSHSAGLEVKVVFMGAVVFERPAIGIQVNILPEMLVGSKGESMVPTTARFAPAYHRTKRFRCANPVTRANTLVMSLRLGNRFINQHRQFTKNLQ
jgi:hypothetical protein